MSILEFAAQDVQRLITHANEASGHNMGWIDIDPKPALILVGDRGVYLMSNGRPCQRVEFGKDKAFVVHAKGHSPDIDATWWEAKRASFGGDDGADTLDMIPAIEAQIDAGAYTIRLLIDKDAIKLCDPGPCPFGVGSLCSVPSGLGGTFHVKVLGIEGAKARVQNTGNSEDFDEAPPYLVSIFDLKHRQSQGAL